MEEKPKIHREVCDIKIGTQFWNFSQPSRYFISYKIVNFFLTFFDLTVLISFFDIYSIRTPIENYWQKNVHIWFLKQQRCFKLLGYSQIGLEVRGLWDLRFIHIFKGQVCWGCKRCKRCLGSLTVSPVSDSLILEGIVARSCLEFLVNPEPSTTHMDYQPSWQ